jgi:hypothetical protein
MTNSIWELIPQKGVSQGENEIFFGMDRSRIRALLQNTFGEPTSHMPDEDDFETPQDETHIRLRFNGDSKLQDIEFLGGSLQYKGIELRHGVHWGGVERELTNLGFSFEEATFLGEGQECSELGINIATRSQVGGDEDDDTIEWIIASSEFCG